MRKKIIGDVGDPAADAGGPWLDLPRLASVEVTSEDPVHPVEHALEPGHGSGWRAGAPGEQLLRIVFDEAREVSRIRVEFTETERERTQQFTLRWMARGEASPHEIVRQQFNFSPPGTTRETEDYLVVLREVVLVELLIVPDISGGDAHATLDSMRLA